MSKFSEQTKKPATENKPKETSVEELNVEELEERIAPMTPRPKH